LHLYKLLAYIFYLLDPFSFLVLTEDVGKVILHFPDADDKKCLEIPKMPPMPDRQGFISVSDPDGTLLDALYYHKEMHNLFISNPEGISLERISPDVASGDPDNWESASSSSGYGTPTKVNSQFLGSGSAPAHISVSPEIVSPDGDGIDDILNIQMVLQTPGYSANLFIFNIRGVLIQALTENRLLGTDENISWDGTMDAGDIAPPGHYILLLEMVHPKGYREKYKKNFVIAGKQ